MSSTVTAMPLKTAKRSSRAEPRQTVVASDDLYRVTIGLTARAYNRLETLRRERDEISIADVARHALRLTDRIERAKRAGKLIMLMRPDGETTTLDAYLSQPSSASGEEKASSDNQVRRLTFGLTPDGYTRLSEMLLEEDASLADFVRGALRKLDRLHKAEKENWTPVFVNPRERTNMHELVTFSP